MTPREILAFAVEELKAEYVRTRHDPRQEGFNKIRGYHITLFETVLQTGGEVSEEHRKLAIAILDDLKRGWNHREITKKNTDY